MTVHVWTAAVLGVLYGVPAYLGGCVVRRAVLALWAAVARRGLRGHPVGRVGASGALAADLGAVAGRCG